MGVIAACVLVLSGMMPGGSIPAHQGLIDGLRDVGCTVRIERTCASSCTLLLGVPGACVSPKAELMFHGPSYNYGFRAIPPEEFEKWSRTIAGYYPSRMRAWYLSKGRYGDHWMSGREAIRLGARACQGVKN